MSYVRTIEPLLHIVTTTFPVLGRGFPASFSTARLAQRSFEVSSSTTAAEPTQPAREQHAFQAQQVPRIAADPHGCWLKRAGHFISHHLFGGI